MNSQSGHTVCRRLISSARKKTSRESSKDFVAHQGPQSERVDEAYNPINLDSLAPKEMKRNEFKRLGSLPAGER